MIISWESFLVKIENEFYEVFNTTSKRYTKVNDSVSLDEIQDSYGKWREESMTHDEFDALVVGAKLSGDIKQSEVG